KIVVESTFNWYWLIDGLQAAGFEVVLAHTLGLYLITGAKVKTDRRDAYSLAKLLLAGVVPAAYIYPVETRPVRDLLRRRTRLVQVRAGEYGSLRRLLLRQGILSSKLQVFSSYCRLVPGIAQSGNVTRRGRASKQGNHYLKAAFSQAAVHAVRCYPKVRRYYERQLKRHQGRGRQMICYNIIAHKLAQ